VTRSCLLRYPFVSALLLALLHAFGCASAGASARSAGSPDAESEDANAEEASEDTSEDEPAAPAESCADDSCVPCGAGLCPPGFYCDESAQGGPACGWVPDCPDSDCDCLARVFADCACDAHPAGARLRCE